MERLYALHFARLESASADVNAFRFAVDQDPYLLYVNSPSTLCFVVRMGYIVASFRRFAGNITFACHESHTSLNQNTLNHDSIWEMGPSTNVYSTNHLFLKSYIVK